MQKSGLPQAKVSEYNFKLGGKVIKAERPSQSFRDAKKGLENLERAAKGKVFISEPTD